MKICCPLYYSTVSSALCCQPVVQYLYTHNSCLFYFVFTEIFYLLNGNIISEYIVGCCCLSSCNRNTEQRMFCQHFPQNVTFLPMKSGNRKQMHVCINSISGRNVLYPYAGMNSERFSVQGKVWSSKSSFTSLS